MKKILIAEDDPNNREIVVNYLMRTDSKYKIMNAVNGKNALEIAFQKQPDLIIMDWEMPVMNGIDAIRELKKNDLTKDIPVIMYTGVMTSSDDLKIALEAGALDFIRKPIDAVELIARVNSMLLLTEYFHEKISAEQKNILLQKEKHEAEINFKQKELTSLTLQMISTNEMLNEIKKMLEKISGDSPNSQMKKTLAMIDENLASENYWEKFKKQFSNIHPKFFEKLINAYPDLTKTELKLCSFIKMNLSTKETSNILNVTIEAVEKNRYRLRKKLNIGEKNLTQHLNSL